MSRHSKLYNNTRWRKLRARQLSHYPLCAYCLRRGLTVEATVCDHCIPHKGDLKAFWAGPFQSLCAGCHSKVKALEEHGKGIIGGDTDGNPTDPGHHWNQ